MLDKLNAALNNNRRLSICVWVLYVVLLCFVSYYHQPWHDEGQAWLIARDDSLWQLITVTTHYEGHPPLWHICLMPFAKLGVPFELGLKSVNVCFCAIAMWFLIMKSPLPWYLRLTIPFSYFCFYQYGVVNRVYSLLMAAIMVAAYYYPQRHNKPYHLALTLAVMSGSQAYGMMLACGIALVWLWEILESSYKKCDNLFCALKASREIRALCLLFVMSLSFGLCILPREDTLFMSLAKRYNHFVKFVYLCTLVPGQIFFSNDLKDGLTDSQTVSFFLINLKKHLEVDFNMGLPGILILIQFLLSYVYGLFFIIGFAYMSYQEKMLKLFVVPMLCMSGLATYVHWNSHHIGIMACFFIFILWQLWKDKEKVDKMEISFRNSFTLASEYKAVRVGIVLCLCAIFGMNFWWSYKASLNNILYPTDFSKEISEFIKINNLTTRNIWLHTNSSDIDNNGNFYVHGGSGAINAYFDNNIFVNLNGGSKHAYYEYKKQPKDLYDTKMKKQSVPDFFVGKPPEDLIDIYPNVPTYVPIKKFKGYVLWKDGKSTNNDNSAIVLYIRQELLNEYPQFSAVNDDKKNN